MSRICRSRWNFRPGTLLRGEARRYHPNSSGPARSCTGIGGPAARSWGIVTSNDTEVAQARLRGAGLPVPEVIVSADNVVHPKPHPEGFLLGAEKLGFKAASVVGIDDSPIGISAAKEAGMTVVAVRFRHGTSELRDAHVVVDGVDAIHFAA
ncbi:HAD family hydrolase [Streptomyces spectabilis]|uniref:HAD-IA family hydrolase n=1 Tax=Streptomyces spectabilis TaxID=68270 RepID=A0A516RH52_STRST|nr:HAD-IA family hydrolase [Streptomyces spectabilis]QDQ14989.1 HAD-IA family hydrolase [Streptomyces spectabilis]